MKPVSSSVEGYDVVGPDGRFLERFSEVVDAIIHMRAACKAGSRVVRVSDGALLAVRVSRTGSRSTLKGAIKKHAARGNSDPTLH